MRDRTIPTTLSAEEWRLISTLRAMPASPLKVRIGNALERLIAFAEDPHCAEMQGDGVPCDHVGGECAQCALVVAALDAIARTPGL